MSQRIYTAILHALSQLQGRWVPPLVCVSKQTQNQDIDIDDLHDAGAWRDFIARVTDEGGALEWAAPTIQRVPGGLTRLAESIDQHMRACREHGARYVVLGDAEYPRLLEAVERPPLAFSYLGGELQNILHNISVAAIVGSRKASPRALTKAFELGRLLVEMGVCVVSGGAFGCDVAAHRGSLSVTKNPLTAAIVFAGGLGHQYPKANGYVFREIQERGGVLISEKLWFQAARRMDFPVRNRIVSGLSSVTVIVEAAETSGALITANTALDQGREVLVLRPERQDIRAAGNEKLIRDGARHVATIEELACHIVDGFNFSSSAQRGSTICY